MSGNEEGNSSLACMARLPSPGRGIGALDTQGRPFAWFEDELEEKAAAAALASRPHLVIWVDPYAGLTAQHLNQASRWLLSLKKDP